MEIKEKPKAYDLQKRTEKFAKRTREYVKGLMKSLGNVEDAKQLIRASGSVGANYIEAEEALSKRDFSLRIKICRKEAKESAYWLRLTETSDEIYEKEQGALIQEATELMRIFGAIITKSQ